MAKKPWPKLSELLGERAPTVCQSCGATETDLHRWREHDDFDRPTPVLVVLCITCSDSMIEPHPRLYDQLDDYFPDPGSMHCCADCVLRHDLKCQHPALRTNGGKGLPMKVAKPQVMFVDGVDKKGRRWGERLTSYATPPICHGRLTREGFLQLTADPEFSGLSAKDIALLRIPTLEAMQLQQEGD